jgi:hypothetical protein
VDDPGAWLRLSDDWKKMADQAETFPSSEKLHVEMLFERDGRALRFSRS